MVPASDTIRATIPGSSTSEIKLPRMPRVDAPAAAAILSAAERNDVDGSSPDGNRRPQQQIVHFVRHPFRPGLPVNVARVARERQLRRRDDDLTVMLDPNTRILPQPGYAFRGTRQIHARVVAGSRQGDDIRCVLLTARSGRKTCDEHKKDVSHHHPIMYSFWRIRDQVR